MTLPKQRLTYEFVGVALLLLIPFIAMNFSEEVNWSAFDFAVAAVLLFTLIAALELVIHLAAKKSHRIVMIVGVLFVFLLVWAELAVGVFGTPFAGS